MKSKKIFSIGSYDFSINHLLIIGILSLSFTTSFLIRSLPADFGWELHEFDPFFNYRATSYLLENGFSEYLSWNDELSWYPIGRDVSSNSQVMLHLTTAITYTIFGGNMNLYDFTILFPAIIGSLTCIAIFALSRIIGGTTSGLIASLLFSISIPILVRGQIGWFKSEPLGIFLGILSIYFLLSGLKNYSIKFSIVKIIFGGFLLITALSAWGGNLFFLIPIGIFFIFIPFVNSNHKLLIFKIPIFTSTVIISSLLFERLGINFISGLSGLSIILPTLISISIIFIFKLSNKKNRFRISSIFLITIFVVFSIILILNESLDFISLPTHRYLNAIYPILTTSDPLTDSVSEHATTNIYQSFQFHSVLMIFAAFGVWYLIGNFKVNSTLKEMKIFILAMGLFGVYIGSAFMRLEVFSGISIILLASIGISQLIRKLEKYDKEKKHYNIKIRYPLFFGIILLLMIPLFLPVTGNVLTIAQNVPPTIMNGGTNFVIGTNDWRETLEWISTNTEKNSVIAAWWDYGYWIQTIGQRPTLADNSTVIDHRIESIAKIFFENPEISWNSLLDIEADYFLIFVSGERIPYQTVGGDYLYVLNGGGDESKIYWFAKIAGVDLSDYLYPDNFNGTPKFWNESFLGQLIPFELIGYVDFSSDQISENYIPNWRSVFEYKNKFDNHEHFRLVYQSSSVEIDKPGKFIGVFVYEIIKN